AWAWRTSRTSTAASIYSAAMTGFAGHRSPHRALGTRTISARGHWWELPMGFLSERPIRSAPRLARGPLLDGVTSQIRAVAPRSGLALTRQQVYRWPLVGRRQPGDEALTW